MDFFIRIGPKKEKEKERFYIEMYGGKPLHIVTDKNMYSEGYIQAGRVDGVTRWGLKEICDTNCILVVVKQIK